MSHLCGESFRSIAEIYNLSASTAFRRYRKALKELPHCADITRKFCNRFCGILLVDGKYLTIKGYQRKIPVLYGIDYLTHDIPTYLLSMAENYQTCLSFFTSLRLLNYPLQAVVSDDNINIYEACLSVYPKAVVQLCQNHYKQNLRLELNVRTDPTYCEFMTAIEHIFRVKRTIEDFQKQARKVYEQYQTDLICKNIMLQMQRKLPLLIGYRNLAKVPTTTNLIESYNSHLEGRLKTIKGFESFSHANGWLNAFFIHRRLKKFTDCEGKFRGLNGKCSLELSLKDSLKIDAILKLIR